MKNINAYEEEYQAFIAEPGIYLPYQKFKDIKITNHHLVGIVGGPSVGKTTLALNLAVDIIRNTGKYVAFFSLDKSGILIVQTIKKMNIEPEILQFLDIRDDCYTLKQIYEAIEKELDDYAAIFIDYLWKIQLPEPQPRTEYGVVTKQIDETMLFQKFIKKPVFILVQPNRSAGDGSEFPSMIQGDGSGKIEQNCTLMFSLRRPGLKSALAEMEREQLRGKLEIKIVKNNFGDDGIVFRGKITEYIRIEESL